MSSHAELIESCLEMVAKRSENIAPAIYQHFFEKHPEAEVLFGIDDYDAYKNDMIVSLLLELVNFSSGLVYKENVKRWLLDHKTYGVTLPMYKTMLEALEQTIKQLSGVDWTEEISKAWQAQFQILEDFLTEIYCGELSLTTTK